MGVTATEGGHWYKKDGEPCYEVENKSSGGMRPTTLRDAKKLSLVPSVTTITGQLKSFGLTNYLIDQAIDASLTTPRYPEWSDSEYKRQIRVWADEHASDAREKGITKHAQIEHYFKATVIPDDDEDTVSQIKQIADILFDLKISGVDDIEPEKSFASPLGFGGKMDLPAIGKKFIGDIKTTEFTIIDGKPTKKLGYPEQAWQLAGYGMGNGLIISDTFINIFVSTLDDSVWVKQWTEKEMEKAFGVFEKLLDVWYAISGLER